MATRNLDSGYSVCPGKESSEQIQLTELSSPTEWDSAPEARLEVYCLDHVQKPMIATFKTERSSTNGVGVMQQHDSQF